MSDEKLHASGVKHPDIPGAFWGCFGGSTVGLSWVMENGRRRVFTSEQDAELEAARILISTLNDPKLSEERRSKRTDKNRIKGHREPGVGKGSRRVDTYVSERELVFSNFKKGS